MKTLYLDLPQALEVARRLGFYVKDAGLLESALARPRTSVFGEDAYVGIPLKAAAMMHSVIKNHPMIDGNKRTAWALFVVFIWHNGFKHTFNEDDGFDLVLGIAEDRYGLAEVAALIEPRLIDRLNK